MARSRSQELGEHLLMTVRKGRKIWQERSDPEEGYLGLLKAAVEAQGVDINYQDRRGMTALKIAALEGDTDTVKYLLSKGADPNISRNGYTATALVDSLLSSIESNCNNLSISEEFNKISKLLIAGGADVNIKLKISDLDVPTLMIALSHGGPYHSNEQIKILAEAGADLDYQYNDGYTVLMQAARDYFNFGVPKTYQQAEVALKTLIDHGANPDVTNQAGQTALMILLKHCITSSYDLIPFVKAHVSAAAQYLIEAGADVHLKDQNGHNALIYAGKAKMFDVARMLEEQLL